MTHTHKTEYIDVYFPDGEHLGLRPATIAPDRLSAIVSWRHVDESYTATAHIRDGRWEIDESTIETRFRNGAPQNLSCFI